MQGEYTIKDSRGMPMEHTIWKLPWKRALAGMAWDLTLYLFPVIPVIARK